MRRTVLLAAGGLAALIAVAACTSGGSGSSAQPRPSAPTLGPSSGRPVLLPTGVGGYLLDASQADLIDAGLLTDVQTTGCPDWILADGTGVLAPVHLEFHQGTLYAYYVQDPGLRTQDGAHVGQSLPAIQRIYPRAVLLDDGSGGRAAAVVDPSGDHELIFFLDAATGTVEAIAAGPAPDLQQRFVDDIGC